MFWDWYDVLSIEFRLPRSSYRVNDYAPVTCPKCLKVDSIRINHLKAKIQKLGHYECSRCRRSESIQRARLAFRTKYGDRNPYQLPEVIEKIRLKKIK